MKFIGAHRGHRVGVDGLIWGVEPICAVLSEHGITIAPSTFYEHIGRSGPSTQDLKDDELANHILELREANPLNKRLGSRKSWIVLRGKGVDVARCSVERVMRQRGWRGANKRKTPKTTIANPAAQRAPDRVRRKFTAAAPNRLWVADFTYCRTVAGWAYTAFVIDVYARKIAGWKVASEMTQQLVTDAINQAIDSRKRSGADDLSNLVHHSDAGSQYTAVAFTQRLADEGILPSIGTVGDSYDNALAESVNSDYKNELVDYGPRYPGMAELSLATAEWVTWHNRERPNTYCCDLTPDRAEELHYAQIQPHQPEGAVT
ncbi:IS3 family transposase [soil metagenome]